MICNWEHRGRERTLQTLSYRVNAHVEHCRLHENIDALPPAHFVGLLQQIATRPSRNMEDWRVLFDEILLQTHLYQHVLHIVRNLYVVPGIFIPPWLAVTVAIKAARSACSGSSRTLGSSYMKALSPSANVPSDAVDAGVWSVMLIDDTPGQCRTSALDLVNVRIF